LHSTQSFGRGFRAGFWSGLPFSLVLGPFGLLFGVIATEAGLDLAQVMGFSVLVIAGAAQITAISLMNEHAPVLVVLATSLAVNLRMGIYSAALVPHFGGLPLWKRAVAAYWLFDQPFALTSVDVTKNPQRSRDERFGFYLGVGVPLSILWYIVTYLGATLGDLIPGDIGIDFAIPATFLALIAPLLRSLPHLAAALTSVVGTLAFSSLPFNSGLLVAAFLALFVGAELEKRLPIKSPQAAKDV